MTLDRLELGSCFFEIAKLAALDESEQKLFKQVLRQQAEFDQMSSQKGKMNAAQQAAHRANTERMKVFLDKKKGATNKIPGWAKDLKGAPPSGTFKAPAGPPPGASSSRRAQGPAMHFISKHPYVSAAGIGAAYGGALGGLVGKANKEMLTKPEQRKQLSEAKKKGPISEFAVKHPAIHGALLTGSSMPASIYGGRKLGLPGAIAGVYAPRAAENVVNKGLKSFQDHKTKKTKEEFNRKRREEYASKAKTPSVPKPKKAA